MGEAASIEQKLYDLFAGKRNGAARKPEAETPREIERRALERLYGERRSCAVVPAEHESAKQGR